ncbi:MAG: SAM-dependent chlorinase/fluorinase [Nitrospirota bacterium]
MGLQKNIITLTTDFGSRDYFSGGMKGVILGINPDAKLVDISHEIASHDIWGAAYIIDAAYRYFPQFTIHVVVVDPGVGSTRRPILAMTDKHYFIAPDNGVLSFIYNDPGFSRVLHLTAGHYFLPTTGSTFDARDIFAPAAAWLSRGVPVDKFGDEITDFVRFNIPVPSRGSDKEISGEVVYIDKFGNCITNISISDMGDINSARDARISAGGTVVEGVSAFYASGEKGNPGAVVNGNGFIEIFINQGDARKTLGLKRGEKVRVVLK